MSSSFHEITAPDFDLSVTLNCGQVFHWEEAGKGYAGTIADVPLYIEQKRDRLRFAGASREIVAHYFALDHPLPEICASFPDDPAMTAARDFCRGLRIIRQPRWECLASFITSSMKQVAHIRQISAALRRKFGLRREVNGHVVYTFPSAARLARASEKELRGCALGYRAKNLLLTAKRVAAGEADLEAWSRLGDEDLRTALCGLPGVGAKVANCVMLFAFERLRAFPIDVWIGRVLQEQYFPRRPRVTARSLREFAARHFGANGGYAQQYLFHHARTTGRNRKRRSRAGLSRSAG